VRSGIVAARDEQHARVGDPLNRLGRREGLLPEIGGIVRGSEYLEVVPHERPARQAVAGSDELLLALPVVDEEQVDVAVVPELERGARADRDDVDLRRAGRLLVGGQQDVEEPAVLDARRRAEPHARGLVGAPVRRRAGERGEEKQQPSHVTSIPSPSRRRTTVSRCHAGSRWGWSIV
jgi:hypothetical protein